MNFEFLEQAVQYTFKNEAKYGEKDKTRIFNNLAQDVEAEKLIEVGQAISSLQDDKLADTVIVTKKRIAA